MREETSIFKKSVNTIINTAVKNADEKRNQEIEIFIKKYHGTINKAFNEYNQKLSNKNVGNQQNLSHFNKRSTIIKNIEAEIRTKHSDITIDEYTTQLIERVVDENLRMTNSGKLKWQKSKAIYSEDSKSVDHLLPQIYLEINFENVEKCNAWLQKYSNEPRFSKPIFGTNQLGECVKKAAEKSDQFVKRMPKRMNKQEAKKNFERIANSKLKASLISALKNNIEQSKMLPVEYTTFKDLNHEIIKIQKKLEHTYKKRMQESRNSAKESSHEEIYNQGYKPSSRKPSKTYPNDLEVDIKTLKENQKQIENEKAFVLDSINDTKIKKQISLLDKIESYLGSFQPSSRYLSQITRETMLEDLIQLKETGLISKEELENNKMVILTELASELGVSIAPKSVEKTDQYETNDNSNYPYDINTILPAPSAPPFEDYIADQQNNDENSLPMPSAPPAPPTDENSSFDGSANYSISSLYYNFYNSLNKSISEENDSTSEGMSPPKIGEHCNN